MEHQQQLSHEFPQDCNFTRSRYSGEMWKSIMTWTTCGLVSLQFIIVSYISMQHSQSLGSSLGTTQIFYWYSFGSGRPISCCWGLLLFTLFSYSKLTFDAPFSTDFILKLMLYEEFWHSFHLRRRCHLDRRLSYTRPVSTEWKNILSCSHSAVSIEKESSVEYQI